MYYLYYMTNGKKVLIGTAPTRFELNNMISVYVRTFGFNQDDFIVEH